VFEWALSLRERVAGGRVRVGLRALIRPFGPPSPEGRRPLEHVTGFTNISTELGGDMLA